jgi:hypothetical protein
MHRLTLTLFLTAVLIAAGCAPATQERTYAVSVDNKLSEPITVFLTKNGPPLEDQWLSPTQLAAGPINRDNLIENFVVIKPGETVGVKKLVGHFQAGTDAVLQIYERTGRLEDIAAMELDDPRRDDVVLVPGDNAFVVTSDDRGLLVTPVPYVPDQPTTQP